MRRVVGLLFLSVASAQSQYPEIVTRAGAGCSRGVDFHALVAPETVFVGQQATYQLGVFIDQATRARLRRNPEFLPPESRSMLSYDLPDRGNVINGLIGGQPCEAHIFRRALFPLTPGRYPIPAASLTFALPQTSSFFSREEAHALRSESATLVAIELPSTGRPADWAGAVGSWRASARLDTARGRPGDPILLTLRVEGLGNVTLLPRPPLAIAWANVVAADERVRLDSTPTALRGSKEFDWLITPTTGGTQRVLAMRYAFFNPSSRRYEVALTLPITVRVAPGDVMTAVNAAAPPPTRLLTLRGELGDQVPAPLGDSWWMRLLLALAPVPSVLAWLFRRPRRAPKATTPLDRLRSMSAPEFGGGSAANVRRAFMDGLVGLTGLDAAMLAQPGAWTRALRLEGVKDETARAAEALLDDLDTGAFGGEKGSSSALAVRASELLPRVRSEVRRRGRTQGLVRAASPLLPGLIMATLAATALGARDLTQAQESFALGMTAYAGADFVRAARYFENAARTMPRAPAAWANAGTASWAAHDTAGAVTGWQRALRLDPLSSDLRSRLALVSAPQDIGPARVLALPPRLPSAVTILLWITGWALVARQSWRRQPALPLAAATIMSAGFLGFSARVLENRFQGRGLAVVADPSALRALPALGAEAGGVPLVGEVARVVERRGVWTRVSLDGGRDGWIATERLAPLGRD